MKRISVVGTSGSGKTTFAGKLAEILSVPHIELDALHWEADWVEAANEVFRSRVREAARADRWVIDGNYSSRARDLVWERADTVVWLDYSFPVIFSRVVGRTFRRLVSGEECCNGNRERWRWRFRATRSSCGLCKLTNGIERITRRCSDRWNGKACGQSRSVRRRKPTAGWRNCLRRESKLWTTT